MNVRSLLCTSSFSVSYHPYFAVCFASRHTKVFWSGRITLARTVVHRLACPALGQNHRVFCTCPTPLAAGTVDSIIGKLRSIFVQESLGSEWNDRLAIVNPVSHPSIAIRESLRCIREEQAQSRIQPQKPPPPFSGKNGSDCLTHPVGV